MSYTARIDAAFTLFQDRLDTATHLGLSVDEPFSSDAPVGVGKPLRALTVCIQGAAFALLGLTVPAVAVNKGELVEYLARRARARHIPYLAITNLRDAWILPIPAYPNDVVEPLKRYPTIYQIMSNADEPFSPPELITLADRVDEIASDLATLHRDGSLDLVVPDADFFVERLTRAVDVLKPTVKQALRTKLGMDPAYGQRLGEWAVRQGIPADLRSDAFTEAVVRQAIYRLLGKIIFYQSLRRAAPQLPAMDLNGLDTGQVLPRLRVCFEAAHKIDYHAVFREDVVDDLPFPAAASAELRDLVENLNTRDFAHLPQDVVGAVFERLIPPEDRHALGQYFTPEPLVDLIVAFCVRNPDDAVLDPTCGTGTFPLRAYDRFRTRLGVHDHRALLSQLWGVDIAPFPAELATINLFRQRVGDPGNFPRILNEDFFEVVPGGTYRFPPLKAPESSLAGGEAEQVDETIPAFDAIVGNFPYISADRIERTVKGYRQIVNRRLAQDWFEAYPDGFTFKRKTDRKEHRLARTNGMPLDAFLEKATPIISSFADLYVSLFWHSAAFLQEGGRMGIVTSNAWLDVGYGYALQRFLLDHFKIVAILESRCEPWFLQAAVNTVVTIVERCSDPAERDAHPARFVQIVRRLTELIPWDPRLDALSRWIGLDGLVARINAVWQGSEDPKVPTVHEDDDFRIRAVRQGVLRQQVENAGQTVKWGSYLRAPAVYFDLLNEAGDKLALLRDVAPPARGSLTGNNAFYHFDDERIAEWNIEPEFLFPLLKSPGESSYIPVDKSVLNLKVFVCRLTKDELQSQGKVNALRYIEWGERQVFASGRQAGLTWPHGAEVRNRKPGWYALPEYRGRPAQLFFASAYGDRHIHKYSDKPLIADKRLYFLSPIGDISYELIAAVMNTSLTAFFTELAGRVTMGDGALELTVEDARDYLYVPDVHQFDETAQKAIADTFQSLLNRSIGSVFDEVKQPDRRVLDAAVLRAMGLDPEHWLSRLYDGLTTLVRERTQLGQMRGQARKSRPRRAAKRVTDDVLQDLLPDGPARFPDDFFSPAARAGGFREILLPTAPLRYGGPHFGRQELVTDDGQTLTVANKFEVRYVLFAQAAGHQVARLPEKPVEVSRTVNNYVQYLRDLRQRLYDTFFTRTLDQAAAERFVEQTWHRFNLPDPEEQV
jgi:type I restriction enzyme M protein